MIKIFILLGIEGNFLSLIKGIYTKPTTNIVLNCEKLEAFPPKSGIRQRCPLSPLLFNIILDILANTVRQEKEIKGIETRRKEIVKT